MRDKDDLEKLDKALQTINGETSFLTSNVLYNISVDSLAGAGGHND